MTEPGTTYQLTLADPSSRARQAFTLMTRSSPGGSSPNPFVQLDIKFPVWERVFVIAPLVLVGTKEEDGQYDLAPKHMVTALGHDNYFGFVCTPAHRTYHNAKRELEFSVSYVRPSQVISTSLAAMPRCDDGSKPTLREVDTFPASRVDSRLLTDGYLHLECALEHVIDDLGENSLLIGRLVAAQAHAEALRSPDRDDSDLVHDQPLLAYLHPGRYATISDTFAFPYSQNLDDTESPG